MMRELIEFKIQSQRVRVALKPRKQSKKALNSGKREILCREYSVNKENTPGVIELSSINKEIQSKCNNNDLER